MMTDARRGWMLSLYMQTSILFVRFLEYCIVLALTAEIRTCQIEALCDLCYQRRPKGLPRHEARPQHPETSQARWFQGGERLGGRSVLRCSIAK